MAATHPGQSRSSGAEPRVARSIHFAHTTRAEGAEDFVWTDECTGAVRHAELLVVRFFDVGSYRKLALSD